ncbi:hypothetical protein DY000_02043450 [Brassica cretica]|uniref:Uncharacterized protein n=1 Tax=Brassica cretica TaxID=69181 RepID=A0ABQ7BJ24_BRACR|nr:hypothetical protein DY000_02043450 [Brassica cretica]
MNQSWTATCQWDPRNSAEEVPYFATEDNSLPFGGAHTTFTPKNPPCTPLIMAVCLYLYARIVGFYASLFSNKTKFFFLWEDIEDIQVLPPTLASMGSPTVVMTLRPNRGTDARIGAKTHDEEGRLKFHFHSFVSFNVAQKTVMALWKAKSLTPEQKVQAVEEESEQKLQSEESGSFLGIDDVRFSELLRRQAQLKPDTVPKLREALPALTDELIGTMIIVGFYASLFSNKTKFFFLWEDIEDIQVLPPTLASMGSPTVVMTLRPNRGTDARIGAKTHDEEGRLKFHFHSFVSFNVAQKTVMALWKAKSLTPEQKVQAVEEESEQKLQSEESGSFLGIDDVRFSEVYSLNLSVPVTFIWKHEWSYLRGGLTTLDRDYGMINNIHHHIGTHVIHQLFPQIPHYHLVDAIEAAKPVLRKCYREPDKSGRLPLHLLRILAKGMKEDHYVRDEGDVVYYKADPNLYGDIKSGKLKEAYELIIAIHVEMEPHASSTCGSLLSGCSENMHGPILRLHQLLLGKSLSLISKRPKCW